MGTVLELIVVAGVVAAVTFSNDRRWPSIAALVLAGIISLLAILCVVTEANYFALRSAALAAIFAAATTRQWPRVGVVGGLVGGLVALLAVAGLLTTGGTVMLLGKSIDPSQRAVVTTMEDATGGFFLTALWGIVAEGLVFWMRQNEMKSPP